MSVLDGHSVLGIILGASNWPRSPKLDPDPGSFPTNPFTASKTFFCRYLTSNDGVGVPKENILDLFDSDDSPYELNRRIEDFLEERKTRIAEISDVFFFFVGHGDFYSRNSFYLATRYLDAEHINTTRYDFENIASILQQRAGASRHILFIDACFAAGALGAYLRQEINNPASRLNEIAQRHVPQRGCALFCASGSEAFAKTLPGSTFTMFSGALEQVLSSAPEGREKYLSLRELGRETEKVIRQHFGRQGVIPEIHTPVADEGDIADLRIFPRLVKERTQHSPATSASTTTDNEPTIDPSVASSNHRQLSKKAQKVPAPKQKMYLRLGAAVALLIAALVAYQSPNFSGGSKNRTPVVVEQQQQAPRNSFNPVYTVDLLPSVKQLVEKLGSGLEFLVDREASDKVKMSLSKILAYSGDIEAAKQVLLNISDDRYRLGALELIVTLLAENGDYQEAVKLVRATDDDLFRVALLTDLAKKMHFDGVYGLSKSWLEEAREIALQLEDPEVKSTSVKLVAKGYAVTGKFDTAIRLGSENLSAEEFGRLKTNLVWELSHLEMFEDARGVLQRITEPTLRRYGYVNAIDGANLSGRPEIAEQFLESAGELLSRSHELTDIAAAYREQGKEQQAQTLLRESYEILLDDRRLDWEERASRILSTIETYYGIGYQSYPQLDSKLVTPMIDEAVRSIEKALDEGGAEQSDDLLAKAAGYYSLAGEIETAMEVHKLKPNPFSHEAVGYSELVVGAARADRLDVVDNLPLVAPTDFYAMARDRAMNGEANSVLSYIDNFENPSKRLLQFEVADGLASSSKLENATLLLNEMLNSLSVEEASDFGVLRLFALAFARVGEFDRAFVLAKRIADRNTQVKVLEDIGYIMVGQEPPIFYIGFPSFF